ncbi:nad transhydrogenase beta subunit family protein, putative [Ichthyophthirius multifiliis]|uniref:Nad transhydrogenase beta subunit family protein, putative n=1 Tax=Ichthyophthirius multifiliis TaxID=5932 RepID=G0QPE2_ICHMU|nr:nad transhydrogenase beta subunit family protein, putative [Ichthyophthirius multifiliis]EGR32910.1 nad transhydrogenase beta subunit family protein, putative [Ichthyophthirius multifiliis]|eukprot:XP_004036896.1 nad transhydrogenase beta subunit family protein, putative [Ichthyophthirius multifiliis]
MNVIIPFQTVMIGFTVAFVGFLLQRDFLMIVGALCITGGYKVASVGTEIEGQSVLGILFMKKGSLGIYHEDLLDFKDVVFEDFDLGVSIGCANEINPQNNERNEFLCQVWKLIVKGKLLELRNY